MDLPLSSRPGMRGSKVRSWFGGGGRVASVAVALLAMLAGLARSSAASDSVTLGQTNLGNIFNSTETVQIPVTTTGTQVSWTCTDFYGAVTSGGPITVTNGAATILPALGRLGYFALNVTALRGGSAVATAETTFAVVTPIDVTTISDSPFGVCTHFAEGWSTDVMPLIAKGGISQIRDEQYWFNNTSDGTPVPSACVEPTLTTPPTYTFPTLFTSYMANAALLGLNVLGELDFSNLNYCGGTAPYTDGGNSPYNAAQSTAYANYCAAVLKQYTTTVNGTATPQIKSVEIWNEYNGSYCHGPAATDPNKNRASYYTDMLKAAYTAVKAQQPGAKVIGGACVPVPLPWFQSLFDDGALPYMDAADIHPYFNPPEILDTTLASLQSLMASYNNGVAKPIWVTECGFTDTANPVGRQLMASYLVRIMTIMRSGGVEKAFWYLLYDSDGYTSALLHGPGDALGKYAPSSAYPAYSNMIQQLYGTTFVRRETTDSRTRFYYFTRGSTSTQVRVLWSTEGTAQIILSATSPLTLVNIMGETTTLTPTNGRVGVATDINPVYVIGPVTAVQEIGRDTLAADSIRDFSSTQGSGNGSWQYRYWFAYANASASASDYASQFTSANDSGQMSYNETSTEYAWTLPNFGPLTIDSTGAQGSTVTVGTGATGDPNNQYTQLWAVRRWQSNVTSANAHFVGYASLNTPGGDGAGVKIFVDGKLVWSYDLTYPITNGVAVGGNNEISFDFTTAIQTGSLVDFVATCGPATDYNYDYVLFRSQISVPLGAPSTFTAWQDEHFTAAQIVSGTVTGDTASPAGDGVPNLIKYAENLDPNVPTTSAFPAPGVTTSGGSKYLTLSFREATAATDLTFTPQVNTGALGTPSVWAAGGTLLGTPVDNGDGTKTEIYQDTVPMSASAPKRFMRLSVTRQQ